MEISEYGSASLGPTLLVGLGLIVGAGFLKSIRLVLPPYLVASLLGQRPLFHRLFLAAVGGIFSCTETYITLFVTQTLSPAFHGLIEYFAVRSHHIFPYTTYVFSSFWMYHGISLLFDVPRKNYRESILKTPAIRTATASIGSKASRKGSISKHVRYPNILELDVWILQIYFSLVSFLISFQNNVVNIKFYLDDDPCYLSRIG